MGTFQLVPSQIHSVFPPLDITPAYEGWVPRGNISGVEEPNTVNILAALATCVVVGDFKTVRPFFAGDGHLRIIPTSQIILDGDLIDRFAMPPGFLVEDITWTVATVSLGQDGDWSFTQGVTGNETIVNHGLFLAATTCAAPVTETFVIDPSNAFRHFSIAYDPFGLYVTGNNGGNGFNVLTLTGNYSLWSSEIRLSPGITTVPYTSNSPAGTQFIITAGDADLDELDDIIIYSLDSDGELFGGTTVTEFLERTSDSIRFVMPAFALGTSGSRLIVSATGTGAAFTGPILLGSILPILVDGSGIYTLVPGKKYDTYYDRSVTPAQTVDMAIPTPRFKTGYFNAE